MNFENIKYMREYYDYSQAFVAEKIGVKRGTYASWECGVDPIPIQKVILLANLFECRIDFLLGLTSSEEKIKIHIFNPKIVIERMKEIRKMEHLSLRNFAQKLNIDHSTLSKNENGLSYPSIYTIYEIAKNFHYSIDWITGRTTEKKLLVTE